MSTAPLLMLGALFALMLLGIPVAFVLILIGVIASWLTLGDAAPFQIYAQINQVATNFNLAAVPLFILMGALLQQSGAAERVFEVLRACFGRLPGGLAIATLTLCSIFAATSGVAGAVEVLVGLMAYPAMEKAGYRRSLSCGVLCAGGSLGTIIPPSIVAVVYSTVAQVSIGHVLAGMLIPGILMAVAFIVYVIVAARLDPGLVGGDRDSGTTTRVSLGSLLRGLLVLVPFLLLIVAVLGSIFTGFASPTEAAAVGVVGTLLIALLGGGLNIGSLARALRATVEISAMVYLIVIGGSIFASNFILSGGMQVVSGFASAVVPGPEYYPLLALLVVFILGFFLDWVAVVMLVIPVFYPLIQMSGIDPVLFAVMVCLTIQTSYITPPMAPSVFYLKTILPFHVPPGQIYRGIMPFLIIELFVLAAVWWFPPLATWLPQVFYG
jgi:tripartite ATP-independent transporter DctM subunit